MTTLSIVSLILVAIFLLLLVIRVFGSGGVIPITYSERRGDLRKVGEGSDGMAERSYAEVLNLADIGFCEARQQERLFRIVDVGAQATRHPVCIRRRCRLLWHRRYSICLHV